jgi:hypothetical protein
MQNRIWNDVLCLLGLTAVGAIGQDYSGAYQAPAGVPGAADGFQRQAWTSDTYGHADSLTTSGQNLPGEQPALATDNYRYEQISGSPTGYKYTWNSPVETVGVSPNVTLGEPTVRYQWADGSVTQDKLSASEVTVGSGAVTTTMISGSTPGYASQESQTQWSETTQVNSQRTPIVWTAQPPATAVGTTERRVVRTESYELPRRTYLRRTQWDVFSSRLTLKGTFGFNVFTHFTGVNPNNIGPAVGGDIDRFYDNGFVRTDSAANATAGSTWFYQYDNNAGQVSAARDQLFLHSVDSPASTLEDEKILPGVELKYEEILGQIPGIGRRRWNLGVMTSVGAGFANYGDAQAIGGVVTVTQDEYNPLPGSVVAPGGNPGSTFVGPGDLLGDAPSGSGRTTFTSPAAGTLVNDLDGQLYSFQLGPFLEIPLHQRVSAVLAAGFSFVLADLEYAFQENFALTTIVNGSPATIARAGRTEDLDTVWGGYVGLNVRVELNDRWSLEVGARYQYLGTVESSVNGKTAHLDLGDVYTVNGGVSYSF